MARRSANVVQFRPHSRNRSRRFAAARTAERRSRWFPVTMVALPVAAFTAVFLWDGPPVTSAFPLLSSLGLSPRTPLPDRERASFSICSGARRINCVVDGDTLWYRGEKIRIADINTPETGNPGCAQEARLGRKATLRLQYLLNEGAFTLQPNPDGRATDTYGRSLYVITRNGRSLGGELVSEGLAERWRGYRRGWC